MVDQTSNMPEDRYREYSQPHRIESLSITGREVIYSLGWEQTSEQKGYFLFCQPLWIKSI